MLDKINNGLAVAMFICVSIFFLLVVGDIIVAHTDSHAVNRDTSSMKQVYQGELRKYADCYGISIITIGGRVVDKDLACYVCDRDDRVVNLSELKDGITYTVFEKKYIYTSNYFVRCGGDN